MTGPLLLLLLLHLRQREGERRERKGLFTLCNHTAFGVLVDVLLCLRLHACLSACSSVCMRAQTIRASTSGSGLQAGSAALKGCDSAVILILPLPLRSHPGSLLHVSASFTASPTPTPIPIPLSVLYRN